MCIRDSLAHVDRTLAISGHDAEQLRGVVARRNRRAFASRAFARRTRPAERCDHLASDSYSVAVILGQVVAQTRYGGMHKRAPEFLLGGDFTGGRTQERRAGEKDPAA